MHQAAPVHNPSMLIKVPPRKATNQKKKNESILPTTSVISNVSSSVSINLQPQTSYPIVPPQAPPKPPSTARSVKQKGKSPRSSITKKSTKDPSTISTQKVNPRVKSNRKRPPPKYNGPIDPNYFLANYSDYLTDLEMDEITNYKEIYYVRKVPPANKSYNAVLPEHFQFITNEHINYRYQMMQVLGKGSFGGVIKCIDHKNNDKLVAIKLLRDHQKHHEQIMIEKEFLYELQNDRGPEVHHVIKIYESFSFRGFFAIVMELGLIDVYNGLKLQNFLGFSMPTVQIVARQTADALRFIHGKGIIHCDFKPENILFMNQRKTIVKMIDFGCSSNENNLIYTYIQSRFYRAPEVVFGCNYGPPIDVWGYGCVLCEMITGRPVFEAEDETELMMMYQKMLGPPPRWMIHEGKRSSLYFEKDGQPILAPNSDGYIHKPSSSSIQRETGIQDKLFLSLIEGCIAWDPNERLKPEQILRHPWMMHKYNISMNKQSINAAISVQPETART